MKSPANRQCGIVAILDALGASNYSDVEIHAFMRSREIVLRLLGEKIDGVLGSIEGTQVDIFSFNDTLVIAFRTLDSQLPDLDDVTAFLTILRKFFVDSLANKILFRGSFAIGSFYSDNETNTIMGQAVTDAAAWYEQADWIGIQATPKASIMIQRLLESNADGDSEVAMDYKVPLKDGQSVAVKAVNWPSVFLVKSLTPCVGGERPKEKLLALLGEHSVPFGTKRKFTNTVELFEFAINWLPCPSPSPSPWDP
jgi:hypothetical protein